MPTTLAPGTRPVERVMESLPNCAHPKFQCAWGFSHIFPYKNQFGHFWLKYINMACRTHNGIPHTRTPDTRYRY